MEKSLNEWFEIVKRGTSGDQVYDILYSWKTDHDTLQRRVEEIEKSLHDQIIEDKTQIDLIKSQLAIHKIYLGYL